MVFTDCGKHNTPLSAYDRMCKELGVIVEVCGFVDAPEWGHIKTGRGYTDHTLFQHPQDHDVQYRIVDVLEPDPVPPGTEDRVVLL